MDDPLFELDHCSGAYSGGGGQLGSYRGEIKGTNALLSLICENIKVKVLTQKIVKLWDFCYVMYSIKAGRAMG